MAFRAGRQILNNIMNKILIKIIISNINPEYFSFINFSFFFIFSSF